MGYSPWGHKELDTTERLTLLLGNKFYGHIVGQFRVMQKF